MIKSLTEAILFCSAVVLWCVFGFGLTGCSSSTQMDENKCFQYYCELHEEVGCL